MSKIGWRDEIIARAPKLISKLFDCDFCLSFWLSLIYAIVLAIALDDINIVFTPTLSTPLTRILL